MHKTQGGNMDNQKTNKDEIQKLSAGSYAAFIAYLDRSEKTARTYLCNLRQFAAWLSMNGLDRPTRDDIISYRNYLETPHRAIEYDLTNGWTYRKDADGNPVIVTCKPATVALYLRSVCQFFKWTATAGIYPNIADGIRAPKVARNVHKRDALEPEDVTAIDEFLLAQIAGAKTAAEDLQAKRARAIFLLAVTAGLRTVEIHRANIKDLETRGGRGGRAWLYIWGKGHTEPDERKPISRAVYAALNAYQEARTDSKTPDSPLFVATGNRSGGKRIATTTISTMLKRILQAAGYDSERLTAHSLRHTAGTAAYTVSEDLYTVQKFMRHKDPQTTEIYLHNATARQEARLTDMLCNLYKIK